MENNKERRRFPRFNLLAEVEVAKHILIDKELYASTKNVCQGGVCIAVCAAPQIGELLDLKISLPGAKEFQLSGKVVWVEEFPIKNFDRLEKFEVGLEFVNVDENVFGEIKRYLYQYQKV